MGFPLTATRGPYDVGDGFGMDERPLTKTEIVTLLRAERLRPNRRRGQHFLIDGNLLRVIADAPGLTDRDVVLEVGAGLGQLTRLLAERAAHVVSVEIDAGFVRLLRRFLADLHNVELIEADILLKRRTINPAVLDAVRRARAAQPEAAWRVVSNPPYSVATPFLIACLTGDPVPFDIHMTLQREVADRLASAPGRKTYGLATVLIQALARVSVDRRVAATTFWPRPAVDSALVRIEPEPALADRIRDFATFRRVVAGLFQARRKALHNALSRVADRDTAHRLLAETGLPADRRPDALTVEDFIALANALTPT